MKIALELHALCNSTDELKEIFQKVLEHIELHGVENNPNLGSHNVDFDCWLTSTKDIYEVINNLRFQYLRYEFEDFFEEPEKTKEGFLKQIKETLIK